MHQKISMPSLNLPLLILKLKALLCRDHQLSAFDLKIAKLVTAATKNISKKFEYFNDLPFLADWKTWLYDDFVGLRFGV